MGQIKIKVEIVDVDDSGDLEGVIERESLFTERKVHLEPEDRTCPRCNARVYREASCPGYGDGDSPVMVCYPTYTCGNAIVFACEANMLGESSGCNWEYTFPYNKNSRDAAENESNRPAWADEVPELRRE